MPARIVIVHDDPNVLDPLTEALEVTGHGVARSDDVLAAWYALGMATTVEVLITRTRYDRGLPHGLALLGRTRTRRPKVKVLFIGPQRSRAAFSRIGGFPPYRIRREEEVAPPIDVPAAVVAVAQMPN